MQATQQRSWVLYAFIAALFLALAMHASAELKNPGFEDGDLSGWEIFGTGWRLSEDMDAYRGVFGAVNDVLATDDVQFRGLHQDLSVEPGEIITLTVYIRDVDKFRNASREIAERAIHLVRDVHDQLPVRDLKPGARVLTVTLSNEGVDLPIVNEELKARGYQVDHLLNPENWTFADLAREYDAVFLNFTHKAGWAIGSVRSVGVQNRMFMHGFFMEHPRAIITSFGSPYHLRTFSTFPNYINVHSAGPESQRAAVAAWFGEIAMRHDGPVQHLVRDYQIDEAELIV